MSEFFIVGLKNEGLATERRGVKPSVLARKALVLENAISKIM